MKGHEFDNTDENGKAPVTECSCGEEVVLWSTMENECRGCGAKFNGSGQMIRDNWRSEARRRGTLRSEPGVGRPGV
jgi:hypothetical protein